MMLNLFLPEIRLFYFICFILYPISFVILYIDILLDYPLSFKEKERFVFLYIFLRNFFIFSNFFHILFISISSTISLSLFYLFFYFILSYILCYPFHISQIFLFSFTSSIFAIHFSIQKTSFISSVFY